MRGEAPTTVEAPFEDVTRGVLNAIREVEELAGREVLDGETDHHARTTATRASTSTSRPRSAGGGLQMMVAGVVQVDDRRERRARGAGAGAIVMDVIAINDGRLPHEQIERIRHLRPDMILLSGGIDGGTITHVVELARDRSPRPTRSRVSGRGYKLPVIYAGNKDARRGDRGAPRGQDGALRWSTTSGPSSSARTWPARDKIHDLFMEHVMAQAPATRS